MNNRELQLEGQAEFRLDASVHFDFANIRVADEIIVDQQIFLDCFANVGNSLGFSGSLRSASGEAGYGYAVALVSLFKCNFVFHRRNPLDDCIVPGFATRQFAWKNWMHLHVQASPQL
jgi:hypothetical protein